MPEHGTFWWNELATNDPNRCKTFYGEVVGWTSKSMEMPGGAGTYTVWVSGDKDVGGMLKMDGAQWQGVPPHWMSYIAVSDVDSAVAKVEPAGGKVMVPPFDIEGVGRIAVVADPTGASIALATPAAG